MHGAAGPVQAAFPNASLLASPAAGVGVKQRGFVGACAAVLGLPEGADVNAGDPRGVWVTPLVSVMFCCGVRCSRGD